MSMQTLHTVNYWTVSVILGLLSALALIGSYPNVVSYAVLIGGTSLVLRFFVRSLIAYSNLERFNRLQRAALSLLQADQPSEQDVRAFHQQVDRLYHRWSCPVSKWRLIWSNSKLAGFTYLFVALVAVAAWTGVALREAWQAQFLSVAGLAILSAEIFLFVNSPYFRYEVPPATEMFGPSGEQPPPAEGLMKRAASELYRRLPALVYWVVVFAAMAVVAGLNWGELRSAIEDTLNWNPRITP